jgi:hypothetical protein
VQGPNDPFNEFYTSSTGQQLSAVDLQQLDALGFHLTSNTSTVIEAFGSTELVQVGNLYYLDPVAGGSGPTLKYQGANITAGEFGSWAPIGAEATASGYEMAWKVTGADQYTVWNTDTNGNDTTNTIGTVSGSSAALEGLETSFHQDLNGDGVIGVPAATSPATMSPVQATPSSVSQASVGTGPTSDSFVFRTDLGGGSARNPGSANTADFYDHSSLANLPPAFLPHEQAGGLQMLLQQVNDGHDLFGCDDHATPAIQIADLHGGGVLIH